MIPNYLPPLANHLWQSTVFAAIAGLLTLALRRNRAQVRHCLWLAASIKFLIPFSVLTTLGSQFARHPALAIAPSVVPSAIEQITQPFAVSVPTATISASSRPAADPLPTILCFIWAIGFAILFCSWWKRWRQIRVALATARPVHLPIGIPVISSPAFIEPGIFGIRQPVLLLPHGIVSQLTAPQLEAILAHELCHVRRRDNLAAAIHMVVEALFWFHPLVWWIGARLMEERERACDEDVLQRGNEAKAYAEGILRICEMYLQSPLRCVAGLTGGNLKKRIEEIMTSRIAETLNGSKKLLLAGAGALAVALPVIVGAMNAPVTRAQTSAQTSASSGPATPRFEVASVKPNNSGKPPNSNFPLGPGDVYVRNGGFFSATGFPLITYIAFAYKVIGNQAQYLLPQLPGWATSERFDIQARVEGDPGKDEMRLMMRALLAERFKLAIRYEDREVPVCAFVLSKSGKTGPQLQPHEDQSPCPTELPSAATQAVVGGRPAFCNGIYPLRPSVPGRLRFGGRNVTIGFIADTFSGGTNLGRPMIDETGLSGTFDFTLEWAQERRDQAPPGAEVQPELAGPSFEDALREQFGIKLQPKKGSLRVLVVDHVERATAN